MNTIEPWTTENLLKLYEVYAQDNRTYNTIVWQFPTAFITINILFLNFLWDKPEILFMVALMNFVLIQALYKLSFNQAAIVTSLQNMEQELKNRLGTNSTFVPNFIKGRNRVLRIKSKFFISYSLFALNILYLTFTAYSAFF